MREQVVREQAVLDKEVVEGDELLEEKEARGVAAMNYIAEHVGKDMADTAAVVANTHYFVHNNFGSSDSVQELELQV